MGCVGFAQRISSMMTMRDARVRFLQPRHAGDGGGAHAHARQHPPPGWTHTPLATAATAAGRRVAAFCPPPRPPRPAAPAGDPPTARDQPPRGRPSAAASVEITYALPSGRWGQRTGGPPVWACRVPAATTQRSVASPSARDDGASTQACRRLRGQPSRGGRHPRQRRGDAISPPPSSVPDVAPVARGQRRRCWHRSGGPPTLHRPPPPTPSRGRARDPRDAPNGSG